MKCFECEKDHPEEILFPYQIRGWPNYREIKICKTCTANYIKTTNKIRHDNLENNTKEVLSIVTAWIPAAGLMFITMVILYLLILVFK